MTHLRINKQNLYLSGNEITGDTFKMKDFIKGKLQGKWNADRKSWIVNLDEVKYWIEKGALTVHGEQEAAPATSKTNNGLCPRCGTYCYGDCTAH